MTDQELPAWLVSLVDQRMALLEEASPPAAFNLIVTPLREPPPGTTRKQFDQWERTCDCCLKYCSYPRHDFFTGAIQRTLSDGRLVIMSYGVCTEHKHG